jgi:hypothetical protein
MLYTELGRMEAVADRLGVGKQRVKDLLWSLYGKLDVNGPAQALWVLARVAQVRAHEPGDNHEYDLTCKVCGQPGVIRLTIDPETAPKDGAKK